MYPRGPHIHVHYGIRPPETITGMVFWYLDNSIMVVCMNPLGTILSSVLGCSPVSCSAVLAVYG